MIVVRGHNDRSCGIYAGINGYLLREVEGRLSAHTEITATSYFFSNSSVEKLGFVVGKAFSGQKLNLEMVFLSLMLRYKSVLVQA